MSDKKKLTQALRQQLTSFISKNEMIIVGISGGSDSMCLLYNLYAVHKNIIAAHINYQTRPESDKEKIFVQNFCSKYRINCSVLQVDDLTLDSPNFEARAREIRYRFFSDTASAYNASLIFTAHHQDDLLENIFIRMFRGSSKMFLPQEHDMGTIKIVRPLLNFTKAEIFTINRENHISWCEDSSNKNTDFLRNYIRLDLLPTLQKRIPNLIPSLLLLSKIRTEEESFLEHYTCKAQTSIVNNNSFSIDDFFSLEPLIQKRVLHKQLRCWFQRNFSRVHVEELIRIFSSEKPFITLYTDKNQMLCKERKKIRFISQNDSKNLEKIDIIFHNNKILDNSLFWQALWDEKGIIIKPSDTLSLRIPEKNEKILLNQGFRNINSLLKDAKIPPSVRHMSRIIDKNGQSIGIIAPNFIKIHRAHCSKTKGLKLTEKIKDFL